MLRPNPVLRSASDPRDSTPIPTEVGPTTLSTSCSHWRVVCRLLSNTSTTCVLMMATPCLCGRNSLPQAGLQRSKSLYAIVFFAEFRRRRAPGLFLRPPDPHFGGDKPMGSSGPWAGSGSTRLQARDVSDRIMFIDRGVIDCPVPQIRVDARQIMLFVEFEGPNALHQHRHCRPPPDGSVRPEKHSLCREGVQYCGELLRRREVPAGHPGFVSGHRTAWHVHAGRYRTRDSPCRYIRRLAHPSGPSRRI